MHDILGYQLSGDAANVDLLHDARRARNFIAHEGMSTGPIWGLRRQTIIDHTERSNRQGGATQGKWMPGVGRYTVTVRRTGAPRPTDPLDGMLVLDVRQLVNKLFPTCLNILNTIMQHLPPLGNVPGYQPRVDNPSRVNLPWQFSDATGHRLRMLYGITELQPGGRGGSAG